MFRKNLGKTILSTAIACLMAISMAGVSFAAQADTEDTTVTITFTAGQLQINSAPSFAFGSRAIQAGNASYTSPTINNPLQIADARGNEAGWSVTATLDNFLDGTSAQTMAGATLVLTGGTATPVGATTVTGPTPVASITLPSDGSTVVNIQSAAASEGMGEWNTNWTAPNVTLNVPNGTAQVGNATAQLHWFLNDAPA